MIGRRLLYRLAAQYAYLFLASAFCVGACHASDVQERIAVDVQPGQVVIRLGDHPLATYIYQDPQIPRPYFKDVHAPGGIRVTRHHPPRDGVDPTDHAKLHPGLWLAFGDLSGHDFWRNKARIEHVEFVKVPSTTEDTGAFTVRNRYMGSDRTICEEVCEYTFVVRPAGCLLLWNSTFQSDQDDFWFGDQEEMGLGVRLATPIAVKSAEGGRILGSKGRRNEDEIWGKQARWCDYSGSVHGSFAGITIMPDPSNFRPCWWHARDYGFMAANPFGRAAFGADSASRVTVKKAEPFHLSYGILIHANAGKEGVDLQAAYGDYLDVLRQMRTETDEGRQP